MGTPSLGEGQMRSEGLRFVEGMEQRHGTDPKNIRAAMPSWVWVAVPVPVAWLF